MLSHLRPELEVSKEEDVGVLPVACLLNAYPTFKSVLVWEIELLDLYLVCTYSKIYISIACVFGPKS